MSKLQEQEHKYQEQAASSAPAVREESQVGVPKDKKQIEQEHKAALIAEVARINKKYEWTNPKDKMPAVRVERRALKDAFIHAHDGADHHKVKKQEIDFITAKSKLDSELEKTWLKEQAARAKEQIAINGWNGSEVASRATANISKKAQDDKEYYQELRNLGKIALLPEDAEKARGLLKANVEKINEARTKFTSEFSNQLLTGRNNELEARYDKRAAAISTTYGQAIDALRKKYPQGAAEWDKDHPKYKPLVAPEEAFSPAQPAAHAKAAAAGRVERASSSEEEVSRERAAMLTPVAIRPHAKPSAFSFQSAGRVVSAAPHARPAPLRVEAAAEHAFSQDDRPINITPSPLAVRRLRVQQEQGASSQAAQYSPSAESFGAREVARDQEASPVPSAESPVAAAAAVVRASRPMQSLAQALARQSAARSPSHAESDLQRPASAGARSPSHAERLAAERAVSVMAQSSPSK